MTSLRRWLRATAAAAVLLSVPGLPAGAQTRRPMTLVDLAELQRLLAPRLSPDGRTFAMVRRSTATRIAVIQNLPELLKSMRQGGGQAK